MLSGLHKLCGEWERDRHVPALEIPKISGMLSGSFSSLDTSAQSECISATSPPTRVQTTRPLRHHCRGCQGNSMPEQGFGFLHKSQFQTGKHGAHRHTDTPTHLHFYLVLCFLPLLSLSSCPLAPFLRYDRLDDPTPSSRAYDCACACACACIVRLRGD